MGKVLQSKEMDQINELFEKAFNLNSNLVFFPVRHHSPTCSYHLKNVIEEYKPDIILIEGPVEANTIKEYIASENSEAPFAIYYSYSDSKGYIDENKEKYRCYYPFLNYSPELVALREGQRLNIETKFIDLPYSEILINCSKGRGLLKEQEKSNYNDDYLFEKNRFLEAICESEGCKDFNEFWEKVFEIDGMFKEASAFVKDMLAYCYLSRLYSSEEELLAEGCIAREVFMSSKIKEEIQKNKKVLVVTGGFHTSEILKLVDNEKTIKLHKFNKEDSNVYLMPYSMEEADALNGYASGMIFPNFYEEVWSNINSNKEDAYEKAVLSKIIRCGKETRKKEGSISTFDEICAFDMCKGLSSIREKRQCGIYELIDGVTSSFIKGELNISTKEPLNILYKELTGHKIGKLCEGVNMPPIVLDFKSLCKKYRLKIDGALDQELTLNIFSSERHRKISCFMHRLDFLRTNFGRCIKGPDIILKRGMNLVREIWKYKWSTLVESTLIDNSVYGGTIKEATISILKKNIKGISKNSGKLAKLLVKAFQMDTVDMVDDSLIKLKEIIIEDGSFYSIVECLEYLAKIYNMQELYRVILNNDVRDIIVSCYSKAVILIPDLYKSSNEEASKIVDALKEIYSLILDRKLGLDSELLKEALVSLLTHEECNPNIEGATLGILYGLGGVNIETIKNKIEGYILGTKDKMLKSPAFLNGIFSTAKDIVFLDDGIIDAIDSFVTEVEEENFIKIIPELRLAFSYFIPKEIDEIAKIVLKKYNVEQSNVLEEKPIDINTVQLGVSLNKYAIDIMEEEEVL